MSSAENVNETPVQVTTGTYRKMELILRLAFFTVWYIVITNQQILIVDKAVVIAMLLLNYVRILEHA